MVPMQPVCSSVCNSIRLGLCVPDEEEVGSALGLSLLAQRDGVPHTIVMDGVKEQVMGEFRKKAREMGAQVKQTEPRSPWQNAAEGAVREVKLGAGRKKARTQKPSKAVGPLLGIGGVYMVKYCSRQL